VYPNVPERDVRNLGKKNHEVGFMFRSMRCWPCYSVNCLWRSLVLAFVATVLKPGIYPISVDFANENERICASRRQEET
jgi:hypothetical protein